MSCFLLSLYSATEIALCKCPSTTSIKSFLFYKLFATARSTPQYCSKVYPFSQSQSTPRSDKMRSNTMLLWPTNQSSDLSQELTLKGEGRQHWQPSRSNQMPFVASMQDIVLYKLIWLADMCWSLPRKAPLSLIVGWFPELYQHHLMLISLFIREGLPFLALVYLLI